MFQNSRQIIHIVDVRDIDFSGTWFSETPLSFSFSAAKFDHTSLSFDNALIATETLRRPLLICSESCEFQKGKKQTHFYRWRGPQSFQQRKCSQSDSISKQFNGQKEMKIAQESVDASRGDI
ncbi:hypothetical protein T09_1261 [Trichinella sp. T9]|nr:hypothetical protein T09_1261 [Trichinella sp. T9]